MTNKWKVIIDLRRNFDGRGIVVDQDTIIALRRCEMTLHRWGELECGDGNDYASWAIERDETTGEPFLVTYPHDGKERRRAIPDREKGALKRVATICKRAGLHFYHQTDPRGVQLYVGTKPLTDQNYSSDGVACNA